MSRLPLCEVADIIVAPTLNQITREAAAHDASEGISHAATARKDYQDQKLCKTCHLT